ncbi:MAG: hypothetical protein AWU57_1504 [Marinobacter sp. T13-3]|nr:MAG: hypothetical protein AWU57_1504 [Marinobacter sp. T13-3]
MKARAVLFVVAMIGFGFAAFAALSLKLQWSWGMGAGAFAQNYSLHVNGLLLGLAVAFVCSLLVMCSPKQSAPFASE